MSPLKIAAVVLIAAGVLGLIYGGFTYISDSHRLDLGVVDATWNDRETVNVPVWAGIAGIAAGVVMLFTRRTA